MLNDMMRKLFPEEMGRRDQGKCPFCGKEINPETDFRDDLSRKEYTISGMCQDCQDDFFQ
jgi:uncharacterized CHY-type Zn-finger protein